ncbi:hypothetical protein EON63_12245 [archaeon]|nr:MAG: hypothetical protein EON63_12245 [archaeon]
MVSFDLDYDHDKAMSIPLGEVTDEQLLAEVHTYSHTYTCLHMNIHTILCSTLGCTKKAGSA